MQSFGNLNFWQKGKLFLVLLTIPMKKLVKFGHHEGHQFEYQSVGVRKS
jgi:hypothetical protein